jgi:hypothetical protein
MAISFDQSDLEFAVGLYKTNCDVEKNLRTLNFKAALRTVR